MDTKSDRSIFWTPIECNAEALTEYLGKLGVSVEEASLVDVYGLEDDLLEFLPQPVHALVMLFPITEKVVTITEERTKSFMEGKSDAELHPDNVFFMRQTIGNACGTIALIHALGNLEGRIRIDQDSVIGKFLKEARNYPADKRGEMLQTNHGFHELHTSAAQEGQTEAPAADAKINNHFVTFVEKDGRLYELDGRRPCPIDHGPTSSDTFLHDAVRVIKEFIFNQGESIMFSLLALVKPFT